MTTTLINEYYFFLEKTSKTSNVDPNLILRQYKLDLMPRFMDIKSVNPKLRQGQIAKQLDCSSSTLQRGRQDKKMLSSYRIPSNTHERRQKNSKTNPDDGLHCRRDLKRPQMTSNDLKRLQMTSKESVIDSVISTIKVN